MSSSPPPDEPAAVVRAGYDRIAVRDAEWGARAGGDPRDRLVEAFAGMVRTGGRVLDLGCGAGLLSTRRLAASFSVAASTSRPGSSPALAGTSPAPS